MKWLASSFAVVKIDAHDGVGAEGRRPLLQSQERDLLAPARLVRVDDADHLGGAIELPSLKKEHASRAREVDGSAFVFVLVVLRYRGRRRARRDLRANLVRRCVRYRIRDHRRSLRLLRAACDEDEAEQKRVAEHPLVVAPRRSLCLTGGLSRVHFITNAGDAGGPAYSTWTSPIMPPSACSRIWQWYIQWPGSSNLLTSFIALFAGRMTVSLFPLDSST